MAKRYPPNHPGSLERVKGLELLFHRTSKPKKLLARIEARRDKAAQDFHAILHPKTVLRLIQILRGRPQGGPRDAGSEYGRGCIRGRKGLSPSPPSEPGPRFGVRSLLYDFPRCGESDDKTALIQKFMLRS